jgi:hypothetical protein
VNNYLNSAVAAVVVAIVGSTAFAAEDSEGKSEIIISGPVERLDIARDTVTVFGREITSDRASELAPGEIVNVYGSLQRDGSIANAEIEPTSIIGSGADAVYLKGIVTDADVTLGQIKIGETTVDYTQQLSVPQFTIPSVGEVTEVQGTQPLVKGVLLASDVGSNVLSKFSIPGKALNALGAQGSGVARLGAQGSGITHLGAQGSGSASLGAQGSGIGSLGAQGSGSASLGAQGSGIGSLGAQGSGALSR